jgi:hypothetical protein
MFSRSRFQRTHLVQYRQRKDPGATVEGRCHTYKKIRLSRCENFEQPNVREVREFHLQPEHLWCPVNK